MQDDPDFYNRLAGVVFGMWIVAIVVLGVVRSFRAVTACVVAPIFLVAIWIGHRVLARDFFASMGGVWNPNIAEVVSAAFTWALVATILYLVFGWVALRLGYLRTESKGRSWGVFKVMFIAHLILAIAIGCLPVERAFGLLTVLDLQTCSLLIHARPGMGSVTFTSHSVLFFFPLIGGLTFAVYAVLVDGLGRFLFRDPPRNET